MFRPTKIIPAWFPTVFLAAFLAVVLSPCRVQAGPPLVVGVHILTPVANPDGGGPYNDVLREMFRRAGVAVEMTERPYERSLAEANSGIIDADSGRLPGIEALYPNLARVDESTFRQDFCAFAVRPGMALSGWDDLKPYRAGYLIGWKVLEANVRAASVHTVPDPRSLFEMLKNGRIDVAVYERHSGMHFARELGVTGAYAVEPPLISQDIYLYLNRKHAALIPSLEQALRDMKADGTYAAIYSVLDAPPAPPVARPDGARP